MPPAPVESIPESPRQAQIFRRWALVQRPLDDFMPWKGEEVEGAWCLVEPAPPLEPVEVLQRCKLRSRKGLIRRIAKPVLV